MSILNNNKLSSDEVTVFPAGFRGQSYIKSKLTTEDNLTTFAKISSNRLNNNQVFSDPDNQDNLIIYIRGYYFNVPKTSIPEPSASPKTLYAFIRLYNRRNNVGYTLANAFETGNSVNLDAQSDLGSEESYFNGLAFCTELLNIPNNSQDDSQGDSMYDYVQLRDESGNFIEQNLKLDSVEIRSNEVDDPSASKSIDEIFGSNVIKTNKLTVRDSNKLLEIDGEFNVKQRENDLTHHISLAGDVNVEANVDIDASLNVGADQAKGAVNITSAGNNATTIIGPDGGQISLPANTSSSDSDMLLMQNAGVPSWKPFSTSDIPNTIVCRDLNQNIRARTLNTVAIGAGQETANRYKLVLNPQTGLPIPDASSQSGYKMTAYTPSYITLSQGTTYAKICGKVDINIDTLIDAPVRVQLSDREGISVQYPGKDSASFTVKEGIINIDATPSAGPRTGLDLKKAFIQVNEGCNLSFSSKLTIAQNADVNINAPLTIGSSTNTGSIMIQSAGNSSTTIIGPNDGIINLPSRAPATNASKIKYLWAQSVNNTNGNVTNSWLPVADLTDPNNKNANSIVITDNNGKIKIPVDAVANKSDMIKINNVGDNTNYAILFAPELTSGEIAEGAYKEVKANRSKLYFNASSGDLRAPSFNSIFLSNYSPDDDSNSYISISTSANPKAKKLVVDGFIKITGGSAATGSYGQPIINTAQLNISAGTLHLPANSLLPKRVLAQETAGVSTWIPYTATDDPSTFVYRDAEGIIKVKGLTITKLADSAYNSERGLTVDKSGQVSCLDMSLNDPITDGDAPSDTVSAYSDKYAFIHSITQQPNGKILATRKAIPYANSEVAGALKAIEIDDSAISEVDSSKYYPLQVNEAGLGLVYIPWENTQYTGEKDIKVVGTVIQHANTTTAKSEIAQTSKKLTWGDSFYSYENLYDEYGHINGTKAAKLTLPNNPNSAHTHEVTGPLTISGTGGVDGKVVYGLETVDLSTKSFNPGPNNNKLGYGGTFSIPKFTIDDYGRVTALEKITLSLPDRVMNTDTAVDQRNMTNAGGAGDDDFPLLTSNTTVSKFISMTGDTPTWNGSTHVSTKITANPVTGQLKASSYLATSDARLKENIKAFNYTKSILDLEVKVFDFIDGAKNQIGCLAQDLRKLYPELVSETSDGYLAIQENKLVYLLLEEVKLLKSEISNLKKE